MTGAAWRENAAAAAEKINSRMKGWEADDRVREVSLRASSLHEKRTAHSAIAAKLQKLLDAYLEGLIEREAFIERKASLVGEKKGLQEEIKNLEDHRAPWLEPMRHWIQKAGNTGEIAQTGSLHEKKRLASEIFGSNPTLVGKKARGSALKPWSFLPISRDFLEVMAGAGIGPQSVALAGKWCPVLPVFKIRLGLLHHCR